MTQRGFALHARTWDVDRMADVVATEVAADERGLLPRSVAHLWPALPGAGVTPVLYSWLAGIDDVRFRPSSLV